MERKIKIAQVIGKAAAGGVESVIMNLYRNIDRNKVQFDFFVEQTSTIIDKEEINKLGGNVVIIPSYSNPIHYMKELAKLFKEGNYDIVHSNMNALSVFTLKAAKKAGIKIRIAHSHSTSNKKELLKSIVKNILKPFSKKYATNYFACSELAGRWLFGNKAVDNNKVTIINNAVDIKKFVYQKEIRDKVRAEYNLLDKFVVGHIGRFVKQKNHKFLIDIFNEVLKIQTNAVLLLVGEGPLRDDVEAYVEKLGLKDKVAFVGAQKNIAPFYQAMDCFVLPSLYEGLPVVGIEAQSNGLPCVFADTITKEVAVNNNVIFKSLSEGPESWAKVICKDIKRTLNNKIENSKYDIHIECERLVSLYEKLFEGIK